MHSNTKTHCVIISKPLDVLNYKLSHLIGEFTTSFVLLDYGRKSNNELVIKLISSVFPDADKVYQIRQIHHYDFPFLKNLSAKKENDTFKRNGIKSNNSRIELLKRMTFFSIYTFIRIVNRKLIELGNIKRSYDTVYLDPFPYKLSLLSLFSFENVVFYDGGASTVTYDYLNRLDRNFGSFLRTFSTKYERYLFDRRLLDLANLNFIFYSVYVTRDTKYQKTLQNLSDCFPAPILLNEILVLGGNLPDFETIKRISSSNLLDINVKKSFRKHPREMMSKKLIDFLTINNFIITELSVSFEYDYIILRNAIPKHIYHFESSIASMVRCYKVKTYVL